MKPEQLDSPFATPERAAEVLGVPVARRDRLLRLANVYFVERTSDGTYAVRRRGSERASGLFATQAEAVERARELDPDDQIVVERVRNSTRRAPNKWRRAQ